MSNYGRAGNVAGTVNIETQWNINHDPTSEITIEQTREKALERASKDCLQSLAFSEMRARKNDIVNAGFNTCTWLSGDPKYLEWSKNRHGLLWIKGHPGVGKSTLMKYASEVERSRGSVVCASFFFYGGGTLIQKNPLGLFRSLLHQILQQVPSLLLELTHLFKRRCETDGPPGEKWNWHEKELQEFFESAVVKAAKTEAIRVYVDALDECGEQAATSLVRFFEGVADSLSICFSCRYYPLIALDCGLEISVENKNAQDIQTFVNHELNKENYELIRDQVIRNSAGNFQWVKFVVVLVLNFARRGSPLRAIQTKIDQIPQELSKLYEELLTGMTDGEMQESLRLIRWIHFGMRPLSLRELRTAMAVDACSSSQSVNEYQQTEHYAETDEAMERRVCDLSRGLAGAVQHGEHRVVQFVHQSVIDFLVDEGFDLLDKSQRATTVDTFAGRSHFQLSDVCIRYLAMVQPLLDIHQSAEKYNLHLEFPLLGYSVVYWIQHAAKCEEENLSASHLLSDFTSSSLLESWHDMYSYMKLRPYWGLSWPITIVHIASRYNLDLALVSILSQSANVDLKDGAGRTPLALAAENGHEQVVNLLLERNDVEADSKDKNGRSPLSYAAMYGHEKVVKLLLERNDVEADSKDKNGRSPLSYAAMYGHEKVVKLLLEPNDVDPNSRDEDQRSPLSYAAMSGHEKIVELLLKRNDVEVDSRDLRLGRSPLSWASGFGHEAIVEILLERNDVDANSVDTQGMTPLSWASRFGDGEIVRLLIERGNADVNSKDHKGRTPMWYADHWGHKGVVRLLEQYLSQKESEGSQEKESPQEEEGSQEESESFRGHKRRRL